MVKSNGTEGVIFRWFWNYIVEKKDAFIYLIISQFATLGLELEHNPLPNHSISTHPIGSFEFQSLSLFSPLSLMASTVAGISGIVHFPSTTSSKSSVDLNTKTCSFSSDNPKAPQLSCSTYRSFSLSRVRNAPKPYSSSASGQPIFIHFMLITYSTSTRQELLINAHLPTAFSY